METKKEIFSILAMHITLDFQQKSYELFVFYPGTLVSVPKGRHSSSWPGQNPTNQESSI